MCRLAITMGLPPSVILEMPARDFDLLRRYGDQEPFGPWRDNYNTAVGFAALFNLQRGKNEARGPDAFMYKPPKDYAAEHRSGILGFFQARSSPADGKRSGKRRRRRETAPSPT